MFKRWRYDFFIIWGNGIDYANEIVDMIEEEGIFEILMIRKYSPLNMKKFVRHVYRCDYVPTAHLKSKTHYLNKVKKEVLFIFIKNNCPREQLYGESFFRNMESKSIKEFKEKVRNKYNPRKNGERTEEHVIHGSDNESQTKYILKYLGFDNDFEIFNSEQYIINYPYHLGRYQEYIIKNISSDDLYAKIIKNGKEEIIKVIETPHFNAAMGNREEYIKYIEKNRGVALCDYYSKNKYDKLIHNFSYLDDNNTSYIVVKKMEEKYLIMDGLHRASILISKGEKKIIVLQIEGERIC